MLLHEIDERSREIFSLLVEAYLEEGNPVGSRRLSKDGTRQGINLSPATIRNVMMDLEEQGLLYAPHTSAGRLPTESGLRLFVDALLGDGQLSTEEREDFERRSQSEGQSIEALLESATSALSELSSYTGLIVAPKHESRIRHVEFVPISERRALMVSVAENGDVENRLINVPPGLLASSLTEAGNFLSSHIAGKSLAEARETIRQELDQQRSNLDDLTRELVEMGIAVPTRHHDSPVFIVRGQTHLLEDLSGLEDLQRVRRLFQALERKENFAKLLDAVDEGQAVKIYIGSQTELFGLSGCSMIVAPYSDTHRSVVGAVGVIGPLHMNYGRVLPLVDYTARILERRLGRDG